MKDKDEALVGSGRQNIRSSVPSSLNRLDSSTAQGEVVAPACLQTCLVLGDAETEDVVTVNKGAARELTSSGASFSDAASRFKEIVGVDVVLAFPSGPGPLASADLLEKLAMEELGKVKPDNHVADGEEEAADHCSRPEQRASEEVFDVDEQGNGAEWGGAKEELAVEDGEVVAQRVSTKQGATMVGPAMEEQMLVEQRVGDEWKATIEYPGAEEEALVEEGGGDKWGPTKGELSVEEQGKLVEQYVNEEWLTSKEGVDVKELEKAVEKSLGGKWKATKDELAVEGQEKVVEPGISEEWKATKDNVAVEDQEEVVEQSIGAGRELTKDELAVEDHASEVEQCIGDKCKVAKDELAAVDQGNVMEQCVSDEWKATKDDFDVEDQAEVVECVRHEWSATKDELTKEEVGAFGGIDDTLSSMVIPAMGNCRDEGIMKEKVKVCIAYPQRPGKLNCPSYMTTGTCMYGFSCHFDHPLLKARSGPPRFRSDQVKPGDLDYVELNRVGLPIRQGVRNCAYYMRNGTCRYGNKCCFNHPEKVVDTQLYPPTGWDDNASPCSQQSKGSCDHVALDDTVSSTEVLPPNIFIMLLPPQKPPPTAEEKETKAAESSSVSDDSDGCCSADSSDGPLCKQEQKEYPERPGRPECSFYVKYGNCKFASACKYHHPKGRLPSRWHSKEPLKSAGFHATSSTPREQEMMEYPERPGKQECPFYFAYRNCKFGSERYYHHPKDMPPSRWHPENPSKPVVFNELHSASNVALQDHMGQQEQYPQRPGEPECAFYLKSGKCKFGVECKYHHPKEPSPSRRHSPSPSKPVAFGEHHSATSLTQHDHMCLQEWYPERPGEQECWYYMHFGKCKYLSACKFHHPKDRVPSGRHSPGLSQLDMSGTWHFANASRSEDLCLQERTEYPEIPDVQDCPFYMKTGTCKFGLACKFNHPKVRVPSMEAATNDGFDLAYDNFTRSENIVHQHEQMVYPERPGEPECSFYMKHGLCKFQMNCRYHHPKDRLP